ncbi:hypothetical protein CAI21_21425 [Alkalilimnicola ehrlichii]|uniref:Porin n=1 Tax=Alkalilimnicola ehrlichii TaxID=351052 RepID=A0A3E0WZZ1_9GAMM|nr:porin [Alkalilimnicola ehrlichii]RFA24467.1 hypothetical protein CAI21_21425 [Alkalilimnicola ehrlichii]RFA38495.1 hypothetical protein CAL65_03850 [Alkalilimnicola ehrlichii]
MNGKIKTLIRVGAGAAVLASGGAMASNVTVHGLIDVWVGASELPGAEDTTFELGGGGMSTSFIGINATQELTPGLTVFGNAEMFFRPDEAREGRFDGDRFLPGRHMWV